MAYLYAWAECLHARRSSNEAKDPLRDSKDVGIYLAAYPRLLERLQAWYDRLAVPWDRPVYLHH